MVSTRRTTRLKDLFERPEITVMMGGADAVAARMVERAGYGCFYLSGGQSSARLLGLPDPAASQRDMLDNARRICQATDLPVFVDMDTGYGDALSVYQTVREHIKAGVAGVHIEDRVVPARNGQRSALVSAEEMVLKLQAAMEAKMDLDPDFMIVARSDRLAWYGRGRDGDGNCTVPASAVDEMIERSIRYQKEADIDASIVLVNSSWEDAKKAIERIPGPVFPVFSQSSIRPTLEEQQAAGAAVAFYPAGASMAGLQADWDYLSDFRERGTQALEDWTAARAASRWGAVSLREVTRSDESEAIERKYVPVAPEHIT